MNKILLLGLVCLLSACQSPPLSTAPQPSLFQGLRTPQKTLKDDYPIEAGRSWTFEMQQSQNGQDNTKFKTMIMSTEALPPEGEAERAVLRRVYPDSTVTPTPSLVRRFPDRVELSRYQEGVVNAFAPELGARTDGYIVGLKLPLIAGQSWEGRSFNGGSETITIKGQESLTVPAGQFEALLVEHHLRYNNGKEDFLRYWYAPGIGMVKMYEELTFYYGQWLKFRSTGVLKSYQVPDATP